MGTFDTLVFQNAFWVFVGIVCGALIQFLFHYIISLSQRRNAKRLFRIEIEINSDVLAVLEADLTRKRELFVSKQQTDQDYYINLNDFNYTMVNPLINSGYFHAIAGSDGVRRYFKFMNDLNSKNALVLQQMLRAQDEENASIRMLNWLLDTRITEWKNTIALLKAKAGA